MILLCRTEHSEDFTETSESKQTRVLVASANDLSQLWKALGQISTNICVTKPMPLTCDKAEAQAPPSFQRASTECGFQLQGKESGIFFGSHCWEMTPGLCHWAESPNPLAGGLSAFIPWQRTCCGRTREFCVKVWAPRERRPSRLAQNGTAG